MGLMGFAGFRWVLVGFWWALMGFGGFWWVLPGFDELRWVLVGFGGFWWVLMSFAGFYWVSPGFWWVLVGFTRLWWVLVGFGGFLHIADRHSVLLIQSYDVVFVWNVFARGFFTLLTNIPSYLSKVLHFSLSSNGFLSALPYICSVVISILAGYAADILRRRLENQLNHIIVSDEIDVFVSWLNLCEWRVQFQSA